MLPKSIASFMYSKALYHWRYARFSDHRHTYGDHIDILNIILAILSLKPLCEIGANIILFVLIYILPKSCLNRSLLEHYDLHILSPLNVITYKII